MHRVVEQPRLNYNDRISGRPAGSKVGRVQAAGVDLVHFDIMDNHYVPTLAISPVICEAVRPRVKGRLMGTPVDDLARTTARAQSTGTPRATSRHNIVGKFIVAD